MQIALAHAQFETIHPFTDGNGRTGRALIQAMLRNYGVTRRITVPLSAGLLHDVQRYYRALDSYREGELAPIIQAVIDASFASSRGLTLFHQLMDIRASWRDKIKARSDATVWRVIPHLFAQPVVTVKHLCDVLAVSKPTVQVAVDELVSVGALKPTSSNRRNRAWKSPEIIELLDNFAREIRRSG